MTPFSRIAAVACRVRVATSPRRAGFTLVELMVAATIALTVMGALATLFSIFGGSIRRTEAIVNFTDRMRSCSERLRQDLAGATVDPSRWAGPESAMGYLEVIEGPRRDFNPAESPPSIEADTDDVLLFTTRSVGPPFVGRSGLSSRFESPEAEVAWFCKPAPDADQTVGGLRLHRLYRRQFLVAAYVGLPLSGVSAMNRLANAGSLAAAHQTHDLSLRAIGADAVPNSLAELTRRECRFNRGSAFPHEFLGVTSADATFDGTAREGEDIVLNNVIGFDVRVFDPAAPALATQDGVVVLPGDRGYPSACTVTRVNQLPNNATAGQVAWDQSRDEFFFGVARGNNQADWTALSRGAYVDLGWGNATPSSRNPAAITSPFPLAALPSPTLTFPNNVTPAPTAFQSDGVRITGTPRNLALSSSNAIYDTWSMHYEQNGRDDDGDALVDEGYDGFDNPTANGAVDEAAERETSPPYPVPLRGVEIRIRCYEPTSDQIRQITIRHTFGK